MMFTGLSREVRSIAIAAATATVVSVVPVAAIYVANSDRVDDRHAVGAAATVDARKGKLVATRPLTGRLPNNIIAKAPNSDRLDGLHLTRVRPKFASSFTDGYAAIDRAKPIQEITIKVPGPGRIDVRGLADVSLFGPGVVGAYIHVGIVEGASSYDNYHGGFDGEGVDGMWELDGDPERWYSNSLSAAHTFQVDAAGTYTYVLLAEGGDNAQRNGASLTATFWPR